MTTRLEITAGIPFRWAWLLYDNVAATDLFDSLVNYTAYFTARTSPQSRFSKVLLTVNSGQTDPQITKFEPNRLDLWLTDTSTALLTTGYFEVVVRHQTNSKLDVLVDHGSLLVARRGVPV